MQFCQKCVRGSISIERERRALDQEPDNSTHCKLSVGLKPIIATYSATLQRESLSTPELARDKEDIHYMIHCRFFPTLVLRA